MGSQHIVADALSCRPDFCVAGISSVHPTFLTNLGVAYKDDPDFGTIFHVLTHPKEPTPKSMATQICDFSLKDGILYYDKHRICVPKQGDLRSKLYHEFHDAQLAGHFGGDKVYHAMSGLYYWPRMYHDVCHYTCSCDACQCSKDPQFTGGLLQPLGIQKHNWESVSMDFLTKLPQTKHGHTSVFVVVDRLSKMAWFIPTTNDVSAPEVAHLFFTEVFCYHGLPLSIVSDRDPKFISSFWTTLFKLLGTKLKMATAHHPQTDGQTERTIRTLEQMLHIFVNYQQNDWDDLLPYAEFAYNNTHSASTKLSPFFLNYGFHPTTPAMLPHATCQHQNQAAESFIEKVWIATKWVQDNICEAQAYQSRYANRHQKHITFQKGDLVRLSTAHALQDSIAARPNAALQPRFMGP